MATVKGLSPKSRSSSISADVNDRIPTPWVGFSLPQAARISFVVPSVVSRAAFAAKQQSRMIRTCGIAFSSRCCKDDQVKEGLSSRWFLQQVRLSGTLP